MMIDNMIVETSEYRLKLLSSTWSGPVVIYISNEQFGEAGEKIRDRIALTAGVSFTFCELVVNDWDRYLTPWEVKENMKGRRFQGQAAVLLHSLETHVVPKIKEHVKDAKIYIAGYSLAGLFALWCLYASDVWAGVACCSGSLWYPGWKEYATQHSLKSTCSIYLSLGKKEKNTKHPVMRNVEDNMKLQYELLKRDSGTENLQMDWHEGGHFNNTQERMEKGIRWLIV